VLHGIRMELDRGLSIFDHISRALLFLLVDFLAVIACFYELNSGY